MRDIKANSIVISCVLAIIATLSNISFAQATSDDSPQNFNIYKLEHIEVTGTNRLTAEQVAKEFSISRGTPLDNDFVLSIKAKLMSLGLFKSVFLVMKKGSTKGFAKLVIEVEDDEDVLSDWAVGGTLGVTQSENQFASGDLQSAPLGYHMDLVSRNLFNTLHRGSLLLDIDSEGFLKRGIIGYGLPKFAEEGVQFDAEAGVIDINSRYIDAMGFGGWGQGLWSTNIGSYGHVQYGVAMHVNSGKNYNLPEFPQSVAGPKIGFFRETRLKTFIPSKGYNIGVSTLIAPVKTEHSLLDAQAAATLESFWGSRITIETKTRFIGSEAYSLRGGARWEFPLDMDNSSDSQGSLFVHLKSGEDKSKEIKYFGSSAIFGLRYHSSGFIAEFALKITRLPKAFEEIKDNTP